jgi:hypothetical protein
LFLRFSLRCHLPVEKARVQSLNDFVWHDDGRLVCLRRTAVVLWLVENPVLSFAPLLAAALALIGFSHRPAPRQSQLEEELT